MNTKEALFNKCKFFVEKRLQTIEDIILSNQKALQTETKSSAGDKHETGRAMLQLEMEKASQQLHSISKMNQVLAQIDISKKSTKAHLGSIIYTSKANYFLAISAGQIVIDKQFYFAISVLSPIGKMLLGKQVNDSFNFNGKTFVIKKIC